MDRSSNQWKHLLQKSFVFVKMYKKEFQKLLSERRKYSNKVQVFGDHLCQFVIKTSVVPWQQNVSNWVLMWDCWNYV